MRTRRTRFSVFVAVVGTAVAMLNVPLARSAAALANTDFSCPISWGHHNVPTGQNQFAVHVHDDVSCSGITLSSAVIQCNIYYDGALESQKTLTFTDSPDGACHNAWAGPARTGHIVKNEGIWDLYVPTGARWTKPGNFCTIVTSQHLHCYRLGTYTVPASTDVNLGDEGIDQGVGGTLSV